MRNKEPNRNVYVGHRYVPLILDEWDNKISYEGISVVTYQGGSYTSKKRVPVGIDILNKEFWSLTGNYNAQVEYYRQETERVSDKLDSKSDIAYVDTELGKKSDKSYVDTELDKKSDITYVDTELGKKSDKTYVDTELGKKSDQTYVDTELDKKANKNDLRINVKEYGAVGNGIADDTQLIQSLIDSYDDIYIPSNNTFLVSSLELRDGIKISGGGVIKQRSDYTGRLISIIDTNNITIRDVILQGQSYVGNYVEGEVTQNNGVFIYGKCENILIDNVTTKNFGRDGIYINENTGGIPKNIIINNCYLERSTRNGISLVSGDGSIISNCIITEFGLCGIDVEVYPTSSINKNVLIDNCRVTPHSRTTGASIQCNSGNEHYTDDFSNVTVVNCFIKGINTASVLRNYGFKNVLFKDNIIYNHVQGIFLGSFSQAIGNVFRNPNKNLPFTATTRGVILTQSDGIVENNLIYGGIYNGIVINGEGYSNDSGLIKNNVIQDIGQQGQSSLDTAGIYVLNANNVNVIDNFIESTVINPTISYAVYTRNSLLGVYTKNISKNVKEELPFYYVTDDQRYTEGNIVIN